jgi:hypothetical protein
MITRPSLTTQASPSCLRSSRSDVLRGTPSTSIMTAELSDTPTALSALGTTVMAISRSFGNPFVAFLIYLKLSSNGVEASNRIAIGFSSLAMITLVFGDATLAETAASFISCRMRGGELIISTSSLTVKEKPS